MKSFQSVNYYFAFSLKFEKVTEINKLVKLGKKTEIYVYKYSLKQVMNSEKKHLLFGQRNLCQHVSIFESFKQCRIRLRSIKLLYFALFRKYSYNTLNITSIFGIQYSD